MVLLRMTVENYRCFKERQDIELRPITVILGKNNSGKSAITRLPLLLATGIRTDSDLPLDLDQLGDDPPGFLDLIYGRSAHRPLRLGFTVGDVESLQTEFRATIQNVSERQLQFISDLEIANETGGLRAEWIPDAPGLVHEVTLDGKNFRIENMRFSGFIPFLADKSDMDASLPFLFGNIFPKLIYLGPYRQRPTRFSRLPSRMASEVGSSGENAFGMLVNDHVRGGGRLIDRVNQLLGNGLDGWHLEVEPNGPLYAINLRSEANPEFAVNLVDSGTGVAHVLPLLVQFAEPGQRGSSALQVIEEPELHLHPAAHALIAELFIAGIRADRRSRYLIETHSETLLLRLRRRIAENVISPDDVAIYFVEHDGVAAKARSIEIDAAGNLDYWPEGVFSEDFEETKQLMKAQFTRERDAG